MSGIKGKVVAITGASSGIGEATALILAERGAKVVLGARRSERLGALAARIAEAGGEASYARIDVKRRDDLANLVGLACERYGKLDVLVSNAGIGPISALDDLRVEEWEEIIDVNLKGVLYGIAAALPVFRKQGFGHFVNIISTAGLRVVPLQSVYAGTKNAVRTISEGLRQEAGDKLRVTIISPGFVHTGFAESMTNPEVKAQILDTRDKIAIPPEVIARAIAFAIEQPANVDVSEIVIRPTGKVNRTSRGELLRNAELRFRLKPHCVRSGGGMWRARGGLHIYNPLCHKTPVTILAAGAFPAAVRIERVKEVDYLTSLATALFRIKTSGERQQYFSRFGTFLGGECEGPD